MPFHSVVMRLPVSDETHIAPALDKVAQALGSQVSIGSYPVSPSFAWLRFLSHLSARRLALWQCAIFG